MATTRRAVRNIVKNAVGSAISGASVLIELIDTSGNTPQAFLQQSDVTTDYTINTSATLTTDANGLWSTTLEANSVITLNPSGSTKYRITETSGAIIRTYTIVVPNTVGPHWVGDILG